MMLRDEAYDVVSYILRWFVLRVYAFVYFFSKLFIFFVYVQDLKQENGRHEFIVLSKCNNNNNIDVYKNF